MRSGGPRSKTWTDSKVGVPGCLQPRRQAYALARASRSPRTCCRNRAAPHGSSEAPLSPGTARSPPHRARCGRRHGPPRDRPSPSPRHVASRHLPALQIRTQRLGDACRHLARQVHAKALVANLPGDQIPAIGKDGSAEVTQHDAACLSRHQCRGTTVAEQQEREQVSISAVSCGCSEHSPRLTTSTRAAGSDRTACCASRSAGTAAEHPVKPISVRATSARNPSRWPSCRSIPGAVKPVQEAATRWVIRERSSSMWSASTARSASSSAYTSYSFMRAAVPGNLPRR
jgi:hypothetical protein